MSQSAAAAAAHMGVYDDSLKILSKKKFDALKLKENIDSYQPKQIAGYPRDVTAIDGFLTHITDDLIWNQIYDATGRIPGSCVERVVSERHGAWADSEWSRSKTQFMDSLGHRTHKWRNSTVLGSVAESASAKQGHPSVIDMRESAGLVRSKSGIVVGSGITSSSSNSLNIGDVGGSRAQSDTKSKIMSGTTSQAMGGAESSAGATMLALTLPLHGLPMSPFARAHSAIVRRMVLFQQDQQQGRKEDTSAEKVIRPAKEFLEEINEAIASRSATETDNLSRKDLEGYGDIVQMLSEIAGESKRSPAQPGTFSSICFDRARSDISGGLTTQAEREFTLAHARAMRRVRLQLTIGCKQHLENQMRGLWDEFVDGAVQRGRMALHPLVQGEGESSRQKLRAYVRIRDQMSSNSGPSGMRFKAYQIRSPRDGGATPMWPFVYHCLRVGDLEGAVTELRICKKEGLQVESAIIVALDLFRKILLAHEENSTSPGAPTWSGSEQIYLTTFEANDLKEAINICQQLYFAEDQQKNPEKKCMYRLFVLNLISLSDIDLFSTAPYEDAVPEIEHYLWGSMWYIQWNGILKICGFDSLPDEIPDNGELELYDNILGFGGEAYFEAPLDAFDDASFEPFSPFTYAKVLICCQRYGDAVNYLWRKDKIFPAIHLALVCLHYGLILPQRPLTENPKYNGPNASVSATSYGNPEPSNIIRVYTSAPFALDYAEEAVDYIMCLNSCWRNGVINLRERINPDTLYWDAESILAENRLAQEFTYLFTSLDKRQLLKICGEVKTGASTASPADKANTSIPVLDSLTARTFGYIDRHIRNSNVVDDLLSRAAHYLLTTARDAEGAIHLYQLAGRYADVLQELISQIGIVLVPPHNDRAFWKNAAVSFYDTFIQKGLGPVVLLLQKLDQAHLAKTLGDLLNLCSFIELFTEGNIQDALMVLDAIDLLPQQKADVPRFAGKFSSLHPAIRKATNDILINAMECTRRMYMRRKNEANAEYSGQSSNDMTLLQLRNRAHAIVCFSISVSSYLRQDTPQRLSQVESSMF